MKKILLFASVVAAMASCAKTEVSDINTDSPSVIKFTTGVSSKGADTDKSVVEDNGLILYANDSGKGFGDKIDGVALTYSSSAWSAAGGPYLWTVDTDADFYTVYPSTTVDTDKSFTVTPATTAVLQDDIVVDALTVAYGTQVSFNLKHILSRVDFTIKVAADIQMDITGFELINIASTAGCTLAADASSETAAFSYTTAASSSETYKYTSNAYAKEIDASSEAQTVVLGVDTSASSDYTNKFMLLPQSITDYSSGDPTGVPAVKITYGLSFDGYKVVADNTVAYIPLSVASSTKWESGMSYMYTLDVTENWNGGYNADGGAILKDAEISFSVDVAGWETDSSDNITTAIK